MTDLFDYSGELPRLLTAAEWLARNPQHAHLAVTTAEDEQKDEE